MGIQQVDVSDEESAETAVLSYLAKGYVVANKRPGRITLQKAKAFNVLWALLGFLFCVLPLLIYMIWFFMQPDVSIVEIIVGSPTRGLSGMPSRCIPWGRSHLSHWPFRPSWR